MRPTDQPYAAFPFIDDTRYPDGSYLAGVAWQGGEYPTAPQPFTIMGETMADCLAKLDDRFLPQSAWNYTLEVRVPLYCDLDALNAALDAVSRPKAA